MTESLLKRDAVISHEMMAHIPLYIHAKPRKIAIIDDHDRGIEQEVLKHSTVEHVWQLVEHKNSHDQKDPRVIYYYGKDSHNLSQIEPESLDVLIIANHHVPLTHDFFNILHPDGILIKQSESPFQLTALKMIQQKLHACGFCDAQTLHYPQPNFASGWRSAVIAIKQGTFNRPREKDIFNKKFITHYYNLDVHKAAFALPEFMRKELNEQPL